jgi:hypothetical protein
VALHDLEDRAGDRLQGEARRRAALRPEVIALLEEDRERAGDLLGTIAEIKRVRWWRVGDVSELTRRR